MFLPFYLSICIILCFAQLVHSSNSDGHGMIVNGETVQSGEAKYQLVLQQNQRFTCGAALIGGRTALTAAHCVYGFDQQPEQFTILHSTLLHSQGTSVLVDRIVMHPAFTRLSYNYDLAILTLKTRISPSESPDVEIIEIAQQEPPVESKIQVTGWGQTTSGTSGPTSEHLLRAQLTRMDQSECVARWNDGQPITGNMFCASSENQSSCRGDSGGPVTQNGTLVGVVSWGSAECLHRTLPNVFVNLANDQVRHWIELNLIA